MIYRFHIYIRSLSKESPNDKIGDFIFFVFCQVLIGKNHYVDKDAPGPIHDGNSWNTAWVNLDSTDWRYNYNGANWLVIGDGDTIFIAAGHYPYLSPTGIAYLGQSITWSVPPVVCPAQDPEHSGIVYVDGDTVELFSGGYVENPTPYCLIDNSGTSNLESTPGNALACNYSASPKLWAHVITNSSLENKLELDADIFQNAGDEYRIYAISRLFNADGALNNIKFVGFTINYTYDMACAGTVLLADDSLVVLEDWTVICNGYTGAGISMQVCVKDTVKNCRFINLSNSQRAEQVII